MKILVFEDERAAERNSHGVFLVRYPSEYGEKILFYCAEWMWLWDDIRDVGDPGRALEVDPKKLIFVEEDDPLPEAVSKNVSYILERGKSEGKRLPYLRKNEL